MSPLPNVMLKTIFWIFQWIYSKILGILCGGTPKMIPSMKNYILIESATSLAARIRNQKVTSVEVVRSYLDRIKEVNDVLNCVVDVRCEEALSEAQKVDDFIRSGAKTVEELERETPYLGVPFTAPDSIGIKGLSNTKGVPSRRTEKAKEDGEAVLLMRQGGGIPLACTNVSESCFGWETHNPVYGRTCNPYDANRSAGGPFGGEAALIASSGSPVGIAYSVRLTSAFNGVFAHKASGGETAAPVSRCSADLLPALKLLTKNLETDLKLDEPVDVKKLKYYFLDGDCKHALTSPVCDDTEQAMKKAEGHLRNTRKASVERIHLKLSEKPFSTWRARRKETDANEINVRKEIVKAVFGKSEHAFIFLLNILLEEMLHSFDGADSTQTDDDSSKIQELLGTDGVLILPSHPTPAFRHNESLARGFDLGFWAAFEEAGLPMTLCPVGLDSEGLPLGFQIVAGKNQDRLTIAVAKEMEKVFGGWKPPPTQGTFTLKNTVFHSFSNEKVKTL